MVYRDLLTGRYVFHDTDFLKTGFSTQKKKPAFQLASDLIYSLLICRFMSSLSQAAGHKSYNFSSVSPSASSGFTVF